MSGSATGALHGLVKAALVIGILLVALLTLLVAWWIATLAIGAWLLYAGARRLLRGSGKNSDPRAAASVIEGEYRVEHNPNVELDPKAESSPEIVEPEGNRPRD